MNRILIVFLFMVVVFLVSPSSAFALTNVTACGTLSTANELYELNQSISGAGTCITLGADNITLDCKGFTITYGTGSSGNGINLTGINEATARNCAVSGSSSASYAIYLVNSDDNTFRNNTINTITSNDYGFYIVTGSDNNSIINNSITTTSTSAYGMYLLNSENNSIINNTIVTTGNRGYGFYLYTSNNSTIDSNNVTTKYTGFFASAYGIYMYSSHNSTITSNNLTTLGYASYGTYIYNSDDLALTSNTISTSGTYAYGYYLYGVDRSNLTSNSITTSGSTAYGNYMINSDNNVFTSHTISTSNTNAHGMYMLSTSSDNNNITSSSISTSGSGAYGIYFNNADNNIVRDSSVSSSLTNDFRVYTGNNDLINVTFSDVGFQTSATGSVIVKWYLDVYVNDTLGRDVENANVSGFDVNSASAFSEATPSNGSIAQKILEEYTQDISSATYKTNYTINVTKDRGLKTPGTVSQQINLTGNTNTFVTLSIVDVLSVETFQVNDEMRSFFGAGETVRIKANTTNLGGFTPKINIKYSNGTTAVNFADMTNESVNYYFYDYNTTGNNPAGYYDAEIVMDSDNITKPFPAAFYIGNVWLDEYNNITYLFRLSANISEPNVTDRFFEPVDVHVNFSDNAYNNSVRVVIFNGSHYIEIPSQVYNLTQINGSVSEANVVWLASLSRDKNRTYFIAWRGTSVPSNYSTDLSITNSSPSYEIVNTYYNITLNGSFGGLLQDSRNRFGSNTSLQGLTPMEFYPESSVDIPPIVSLTVRDYTTPNITVVEGPVFVDYTVSGFLTGNSKYPYNITTRFFARNPFYTEEKNISVLESKDWFIYFGDEIAWADGKFSTSRWENSSGDIAGQNVSSGNNADSMGLDANMRWIAAYHNDIGDAFGTIFLNRSNSNETNPVIDFKDDSFDFYRRTIMASSTTVNTGSSFYTKVARVIYDGVQEDSLVDELYDQLNASVNVSLGAQENFDKVAPNYVAFNVTPANATDQQNLTCFSSWTDNIELFRVIIEENTSGTFRNTTVSLSGTSGDGNLTINVSELNAGTFQCTFYGQDSSFNTNVTSPVIFTVTDLTAPEVSNVTTSPNITADVDPNVTINITAEIIEYTSTDTVIFQYKEWNASDFINTTMINISNSTYEANFTPDTEDNWTYRIYTNDTLGNAGTSSETNISVDFDYTWNISSDDFVATNDLGDESAVLGENTTLGTLIIGNTGDFALNFSLSSNLPSRVFFNASSFAVPAKDNTTINITGQADSVERSDDIVITLDATDATANPSQMTVNVTMVSFSSGPFLLTQITQFNSTVTQGDAGIFLEGKLTNKGNETATDTAMQWTLPSGWSTTENTTHSLGTVNVDGFKIRNITITVDESAPTGEQTLTLTSTCCNDSNRTKNDSVTVAVLSMGGEETVIISPGGGGNGGASGGGGISQEEREQLFSTEERFELVRGEDTGFIITIENPFDVDFENVTINVSGFLAGRISLDKTYLGTLGSNTSVDVTVFIDAPSYFSRGINELKFTISGFKGVTHIVEERKVILIIHELPREEALAYQSDVQSLLEEMKRMGFYAEQIESIANQIKTKLGEGDYLAVKELNEQAQEIRDTAFDAFSTMNKTEQELARVEYEGLSAPKAIRLHNLAKAAFERGDFFLAKSRADESLLTLALEIKGEFNYLNFVVRNWWQVSLASFILFLISLGIYFKTKLSFINRELKRLNEEEGIIVGLVKEVQRDCFELAKMSMDEYTEAVTQYEDKLSKNMQRIIELGALKANLFSFSKRRALKIEEQQLMELMKETQRDYLEKKSIETNVYFRRINSLRERLIMVDEELTTLEAREAIKTKTGFRRFLHR